VSGGCFEEKRKEERKNRSGRETIAALKRDTHQRDRKELMKEKRGKGFRKRGKTKLCKTHARCCSWQEKKGQREMKKGPKEARGREAQETERRRPDLIAGYKKFTEDLDPSLTGRGIALRKAEESMKCK